MSWQVFRWTWRLDAPLFVGTTPAGALNRCRLYVPARAVWGAVTAELARLEASDDQKYGHVGEELRQHARFSYLYPAELVGKHWRAWLPEYREDDGFVWKREDSDAALAARTFRRRLIWTRPATAIDPENDSALDGSLRETECVQPRWRRDDNSPGSAVGMVGYVFLRDGQDLATRLQHLPTLFIGGDTRYGFGRIERVSFEPTDKLFDEAVGLDDETPQVSTNRALAHAVASAGAPMRGAQEAIGGWDMTGQQTRHQVSGPVWTPGSQIVGGDGSSHFRIDKRGLWQLDGQSGSQATPNEGPSS